MLLMPQGKRHRNHHDAVGPDHNHDAVTEGSAMLRMIPIPIRSGNPAGKGFGDENIVENQDAG